MGSGKDEGLIIKRSVLFHNFLKEELDDAIRFREYMDRYIENGYTIVDDYDEG